MNQNDELIIRFAELALKKAPRYDNFKLHELIESLNLSKGDMSLFINNISKVKRFLIDNNYCKYYNNSHLLMYLTETGRDYFKPKEVNDKGNTYNVHIKNSSVGQFNQDSLLENSPITKNVNAEPNINPAKKSSVKKILNSVTNNGFFILIVGIVIEEITIGKIWKYIVQLFN